MASRSLGALALFLLSALAPAFVSQAPVASRLRPLTTQAALERAPMRAWPFGPAPTPARPWLWRLRDNLAFFSLALSALTFALNFRNSKQGRVLQAVKTMMKPFKPELAKDRVAERYITGSIAARLENWNQHAMVIAGRFGSGKTVALEEALRGRQGVYVHTVRDKDWEKSLYYDLGIDNLGMLENVLRLVRERNRGSTPVLVLDIPRKTKEGIDAISTFAKILSSDGSLAHVIVCASSAAMALTFDAGGPQRQVNYWVDDLTEDEAEELLTLHGHKDKTKEFLAACGYNALDLVLTCQRYAEVGQKALDAKKAEMEKRASEDVETFLRDCKFKTVDGITPAGANILKALLQNRTGVGKLAGGSGTLPKDVAKWIRERDAHAVVWHIQEEKYQFASELHADIAARFKKQIDDLSSKP